MPIMKSWKQFGETNWRGFKTWLKYRICMPSGNDDALELICDVLIFVATSSEQDQLKKVATSLGLTFKRKRRPTFDYYILGLLGTYRVVAVRTEMGPYAHEGSAACAILAKIETRATALISLGMAFGISRDHQK